MAGNSDRISVTYDENQIVSLLKSYKDIKKQNAVFESNDPELEFLDKCLRYLDDYERDILEKTFIDGVSMRKYALYSGFSRNFIAKQRLKSVALIAKFFNINFN